MDALPPRQKGGYSFHSFQSRSSILGHRKEGLGWAVKKMMRNRVKREEEAWRKTGKKNILRGNTNPMTVRSNLLFNFNLILTQRFLQFSDNGVGFNIFSFDLSKDSQRKRKK